MSRVSSLRIALLLSAVLISSSFLAFGQSDTASISGFVRDPSSSSVPNATVVIKNEVTGIERRTTTNESGYYIVSNLPPGLYTVTVEAAGFKKYEKTNNKLDANIATAVERPQPAVPGVAQAGRQRRSSGPVQLRPVDGRPEHQWRAHAGQLNYL